MKNRFRHWIQSLKNSSLQSKIALLSTVCATVAFFVSASFVSNASESSQNLAAFFFHKSISLFFICFIAFFCLAGYHKDRVLLALVSIVCGVFPLYSLIQSMVEYTKEHGTLELFFLGMFLSLLFLAVINYNLGVLVRMIRYKNERKRMWLRIIIIVLSALLVPIFIVLAMLSALGGGFSMP